MVQNEERNDVQRGESEMEGTYQTTAIHKNDNKGEKKIH